MSRKFEATPIDRFSLEEVKKWANERENAYLLLRILLSLNQHINSLLIRR